MAKSEGPQQAAGGTGPGKPTDSGSAGAKRRGWSRWRPYTAAVVAAGSVFAVSALIGAHVRAGRTAEVMLPAGVPKASPLAIPVTPSVPVTMTVYEDLRSPKSKAFAAQYAGAFAALLASGQVTIDYRLVTPVDAEEGGRGSLLAANAAACARDQGSEQFQAYVRQLWDHQPPVGKDSFAGTDYLEELGRKVRDLDASVFVPCVHSTDHLGWVLASQKQYAAARLPGVPVLQINGRTVDPAADGLTPAKLADLVRQAAAEAAAAYAAAAASQAPASAPASVRASAASSPASSPASAAPAPAAASASGPSASPSPSAS